MTGSRGFAIAVATLIWAIAVWFGFIAISSDRAIASVTIAIGLVFSVYSLAAFSGVPDVADRGFRGALVGLGTGILLVLATLVSGSDWFAIAAPAASFGFGCAVTLEPNRAGSGRLARFGVVVVVALVLVWVFNVDRTVYGLVSPLVVLPALVLTDRIHDRAREVLAETTPD